ncbi:MAG: toprim protein [Pseudomonadota bacterium]|nr:toprim protein [Pseudomonadota bacterium]
MTPRRDYTEADARDAAPFVPMDGTRDEWVRALAAGLSDDELIELSSLAPNYGGERATRSTLRSLRGAGVGAGTWFYLARLNGWRPAAAGETRPARPAPVVRAVAPEPERHQRETLSPYGRRLWASSLPLAGTVGADYLTARGCFTPPEDGDLRFLPAHRHPLGDYIGPALVALVTDIETCTSISLHITWVRPDGTKADTPGPARLLLGGHRKAGGVIRLWPDEAVTHGLAVGEGIESCLSLAHAFTPVWSCIDAGNLAALPVLAGVEALTVARDNDPAGRRAAQTVAERWAAAGAEVAIVAAVGEGQDLNNVTSKEAA